MHVCGASAMLLPLVASHLSCDTNLCTYTRNQCTFSTNAHIGKKFYAPAVNIPAVAAIAAATATAGVAAVTTRLRSTGGSSVRPATPPLHSSLGGLCSCTLARSLLHCLSLWGRTSNGRKHGTDWPAVSGIAAAAPGTAVAAVTLGAAIAAGTDCAAVRPGA